MSRRPLLGRGRSGILVWVTVAACIGALAACGSSSPQGVTVGGTIASSGAKGHFTTTANTTDVRLTGCTIGTGGLAEAIGTVHNTTKNDADYLGDVAFLDGPDGRQLGSGRILLSGPVAAGKTSQWSATGPQVSPGTPLVCKLTSTQRLEQG